MTEFEWDDAKRLANIQKHNVDFDEAELFFDGRATISTVVERNGETRFLTTAFLTENYFTLIWTSREDRIRVISIRRAHDNEERAHRALHGGGTSPEAGSR